MATEKPSAWPSVLIAGIGLLVLTTVMWCCAYKKWSSSDWRLPATYAEPVYSDFIGGCGIVKARSEGLLGPFTRKTIPQLAAPDIADWSASPSPDEIVYGLFGMFARAFGLFAGHNFGVLFGFLAAAAAFYVVATRWLEAASVWSFVGALAFGLAPYFFAESPHHITCLYAWHIPLFPVVWTWIGTSPGLEWRSRRFWQALAIGLIVGLQNPYFTYVFCQLTLLSGAVVAWRRRSMATLMPAVAVVGAAAIGFLLVDFDTIVYRLTHPVSEAPLLAHREYRWMDIYGFKIIDMFIPSFTHHSDTLAKFGLLHRQASVLNDEEGCAYLGLLGIGCLLAVVAKAVQAIIDGKLEAVPIQAWWILWIVIFFNTGGLNSMIAAFTGFTLFRTATRYSVVMLVIVLLYAVQRLTAWQRDAVSRYPTDMVRIGTITAAIAASLLVLWDQVPRGPAVEKTALIEKLVESDRAFVAKLETALANKAMVFQLPVMDGTSLPGVASSDHYRPYLYSAGLHWSHGALPGSKTLQWQQSVQQRLFNGAAIDQQAQRVRFDIGNVRQAVDEMRGKGFAAIYINRNGVPDRGKGLFDALLELGYDKPPIYSAAGDLACVLLGAPPTGVP